MKSKYIQVFISGGPASQKGSIIEELTSSFNFTSISVEDIVFQYLPSRLSGTGTQIKDIQEALRVSLGGGENVLFHIGDV